MNSCGQYDVITRGFQIGCEIAFVEFFICFLSFLFFFLSCFSFYSLNFDDFNVAIIINFLARKTKLRVPIFYCVFGFFPIIDKKRKKRRSINEKIRCNAEYISFFFFVYKNYINNLFVLKDIRKKIPLSLDLSLICFFFILSELWSRTIRYLRLFVFFLLKISFNSA